MIKLLILIVIGILVLSFFGITIQSVIQSPAGQANFGYVWSLVVMGWDWLVNFVTMRSADLQHVVSK